MRWFRDIRNECQEFGATEKRKTFANELNEFENPGRWERNGSDIFTVDPWKHYKYQIRVSRGLVNKLADLQGTVFFYADKKQVGTGLQVRLSDEERESCVVKETVNRPCRYAAHRN